MAQSKKTETPKADFYCETVALKNWNCDLNGTIYDFKRGDRVLIKEKWHLDKLAHPMVEAVANEVK